MRTAEIIISEYLGQGCSLEGLRVLAESRSEPLRSEMMAILARMESENVGDVQCEPASFFMSDEEKVEIEEIGVDFDIMAATEESVAEITIDETEEAVLVPFRPTDAEFVGMKKISVRNPDVPNHPQSLDPNAALESIENEPEALDTETRVVSPDERNDIVPEPVAAESAETPAEASSEASENGGDYLPLPETRAEDEASAPAAPPASVIMAPQPAIPELAAPKEVGKKEARRDRRRRERAEKKKQKQARKEAAIRETVLPEIVLTRSDDTDTMVPDDDAGNHAMIIASGGVDLRSEAYQLLHEETNASDAGDREPQEEKAVGNNVILFRAHFAYHDADEEFEDQMAESASRLPGQPLLRMLPNAGDAESAGTEEPEPAEQPEKAETAPPVPVEAAAVPEPAAAATLSDADRLGLLAAFVGIAEDGEAAPAVDAAGENSEHVIVGEEPEPFDPLAEAEAARKALETEYQERLDEFARRLLEVQAVAAAKETLLREQTEEIGNRDAELIETRGKCAELEAKSLEAAGELDKARDVIAKKQAKLDGFGKILDEHERLYAEFEDLRVAYNEVVVEVMPALQNERDDLALAVERQCESQDKLRSSLGSARRRLAVGYSMGAAACMMLVGLPLFNWLRSGEDSRDLAQDRQKTSELMERLEKAEMRNVKYEKDLFELERRTGVQLAEMQDRNRELARLADQRPADAGRSGTPTRTSAMIGPANGRLVVNEVRDPAGQIDKTVADNRARYSDINMPAPPSEGNSNASRIAVSAVASTRPQNADRQSPPALRPPAANAATGTVPANRSAATVQTAAAAKPGEVKAKVKAGEGVAQVVYRILGTRDPEVINWVIRENNIKNDRRGNPRIYPDQELRLPQGGRTAQTASR